jgi:hypothetical protein
MLMRIDPLRELDRVSRQLFGNLPGTGAGPGRFPWTPTAPVTSSG